MADSRYIVELEETVEKMNVELSQSHTKISELDAKVREQEEGLSTAQVEMNNLREENARLARDLKESEDKCRTLQERLDLHEQKLALFSQKPETAAEECLAQVNESNEDALNINALPNEIILEVLGHLTQNQLGQIAKVCRRWNVLTKSPVLWKKVNVKIFPSDRSENSIVKSFINTLPSRVTSMRLDFSECNIWVESLDFAELCPGLQEKCPHLEELILMRSLLTNSLSSIIGLCTQFLQEVKNLTFHYTRFRWHHSTGECFGISKIKILGFFNCSFDHPLKPPFSKMPHLEQLHLSDTNIDDFWFEDDISFLNQLHVLNLRKTLISAETFQAIQNHGINLKEFYVCEDNLEDHDLNFSDSVFPNLKTICLFKTFVALDGEVSLDTLVPIESVVSLIQSCPSLENVYADERVAELCAAHPFVVANRCKAGIVKAVDWDHNHNVDYSYT